VEGVVMHLEAIPVVEIQGKCFVDSDGRKMTPPTLVFQAKYLGEKICRRLFVMRRYNRVIQCDWHNSPPSGVAPLIVDHRF
jgi:hypothetical protein